MMELPAPEWISAVGTAIAALATIPLWVVSWRAANAAKRSADAADKSATAAMWIELPLITGEIGDMLHVTEPVPEDGPYGGAVINDIPDQYAAVTSLLIRNHGRSVAMLDSIMVGHSIGCALPEEPSHTRTYRCDQNMVVAPGETESVDLSYTIETTDEQREQLNANQVAIWLYAEINFRDFMDVARRAGLAWSYTQLHGVGAYYFQPITVDAPKFRFRS